MTPERKKWWDGLSEKEKYLRTEIEGYEEDIKDCKYALNDSTNCLPQIYKGYIRRDKYTLAALKHELERGGKCRVICRDVCNLLMTTCAVCGAIVPGGSNKPVRFCPHCGRKIKYRY